MPAIISRGSFSGKAFGLTGQTAAPVYVEDVFSTYLYTGTGSAQTITNNIDLSTKGGLVWLKGRSGATAHALYDTARGATSDLVSNTTAAATTQANGLTAFGTTGFTIGSLAKINTSSATYVSWTFRKQPKFFDIVTYTGDGTTTSSLAHNLGSLPGLVIIKATSTTSDWHTIAVFGGTYLGGQATPANQPFALNLTDIAQSSATATARGLTTTNFNPGRMITDGAGFSATGTNTNGVSYVAYLFANQAGGFGLSGSDSVVACGSFTGASTVNLGWEPQLLIVKRTDTTGNWQIIDNMRGMPVIADYTGSQQVLFANTSGSESTSGIASPNSTGFNPVSSTGTYIYLAIRRGPMKVPTSGTSVFSPVVYSGNSAARTISAGFVPDVVWFADRSAAYWGENTTIFDRLRGLVYSVSSGTGVETSLTPFVTAFGQAGINITNSGMNNATNIANGYLDYFFGRAPGYMDEVCYTGTGTSGVARNHNLNVVPEWVIIKSRSVATDWQVWRTATGTGQVFVRLNSSDGDVDRGAQIMSALPTATQFTLGSWAGLNGSGTNYVAYFFATCPGVSKVGSYTGTGAAQNINCGFSAGARFVLIKRTDNAGDWYVYNSATGISSGTDPYLLMNSTAAQVTGTNYVDTFASGFTLTATAPAALNANGGSYIFLAIA